MVAGRAGVMAWAGSTRHQRLPRDWAALRRAVLARDAVCQLCGLAPPTEVDHRVPGDDHALANLQGVCTPCHRSKSAREGAAAARRTPRPTDRRPLEAHPGLR